MKPLVTVRHRCGRIAAHVHRRGDGFAVVDIGRRRYLSKRARSREEQWLPATSDAEPPDGFILETGDPVEVVCDECHQPLRIGLEQLRNLAMAAE